MLLRYPRLSPIADRRYGLRDFTIADPDDFGGPVWHSTQPVIGFLQCLSLNQSLTSTTTSARKPQRAVGLLPQGTGRGATVGRGRPLVHLLWVPAGAREVKMSLEVESEFAMTQVQVEVEDDDNCP